MILCFAGMKYSVPNVTLSPTLSLHFAMQCSIRAHTVAAEKVSLVRQWSMGHGHLFWTFGYCKTTSVPFGTRKYCFRSLEIESARSLNNNVHSWFNFLCYNASWKPWDAAVVWLACYGYSLFPTIYTFFFYWLDTVVMLSGWEAHKSINHVLCVSLRRAKSIRMKRFMYSPPHSSNIAHSQLNYLTAVSERDICTLENEHKTLSYAHHMFHIAGSRR